MKGKSYQEIANETIKELSKNTGWIKRYADYYYWINPKGQNSQYVSAVMSCFRANSPLTKYLSISRVKNILNYVDIDLRINGHSVAFFSTKLNKEIKEDIKENRKKHSELKNEIQKNSKMKIKKSGLEKVAESETIEKEKFNSLASDFGDNEYSYTSSDAIKFRKELRSAVLKGIGSEHTVESLLLKILNDSKKEKSIKYIKPIRLCGAFFQLVTPIAASSVESEDVIKYSKNEKGQDHAGGGIDILARIKNADNSPEICVIELKDNYDQKEKPTVAIKQAIAYATFLDTLIRCKDAKGDLWYRDIIGINKKLDGPIKINAVIAMPFKDDTFTVCEEDKKLANEKVTLKNGDTIEPHYFFFDKNQLYNPKKMKYSCSLKTYGCK